MKCRWSILIQAAVVTFTQVACADNYLQATESQGQEITAAYFGVHFHRLLVLPHENAVQTLWPPLSFGTVRLWDSVTRWADIAPHGGEWDFERIDHYVNTAVAHGATVLYTLGSTPRWASARPNEACPYGQGCGAEPVRLAHWEEYIRRTAQRYGKRIAAYELWNEPNFSDIPRDRGISGFYTGSVFQMVEMARVARKVLDDYSPDAKLCTPGFVNGTDRLDLFLAAGGKKYVQAICYHLYSENSEHFVRQILEVRSIMKRHGLEHLALWNTETGVETLSKNDPSSGIAARSPEEAVARMSQMLILGAATGLGRFDYYAWDNERSGMVSSTGSRLAGYEMMQRLQKWLLGARLKSCRANGVVVLCDGERGLDRFILAWAAKSVDERSIIVPKGWRIAAAESLTGKIVALASKRDAESLILGSLPTRFMLERVVRP